MADDAWKTFGVTIIIVLIVISAVLVVAYISRECNDNLDCSSGEYCAYNHKCVPFPDQANGKNSLGSAFIIGISIVIGALLLGKNKN